MESLSLLEFKTIKENTNKQKINYYNASGFVSSKNEINDITNIFSEGKYKIETLFTIIYLYDYMCDSASRDFIAMYGGELHKKTSSNITILTYFSTDTAMKWPNVYNRDKIRCNDDNDPAKVMKIVNNLKETYNVQNLPAMVIIKKDESFILPIEGSNKEIIKRYFYDVIKKIDEHCEEDISVIKDYIIGPNLDTLKNKKNNKISVSEFICKLVDDEGYRLDDLALEMGISVKTLYNKREKVNDNKFTRDECFFIAIRFGIGIAKLQWLLREYNNVEIGMGGRDGVLYNAIIAGRKGEDELLKINDILVKKYGKGIINEKSILLE